MWHAPAENEPSSEYEAGEALRRGGDIFNLNGTGCSLCDVDTSKGLQNLARVSKKKSSHSNTQPEIVSRTMLSISLVPNQRRTGDFDFSLLPLALVAEKLRKPSRRKRMSREATANSDWTPKSRQNLSSLTFSHRQYTRDMSQYWGRVYSWAIQICVWIS